MLQSSKHKNRSDDIFHSAPPLGRLALTVIAAGRIKSNFEVGIGR